MSPSLFLVTSPGRSSENRAPLFGGCQARKSQTERGEGGGAGKRWEKRRVRMCIVERGEIWSNEPIPMFGANDEPGGEASIHSPDVCKMVAGVIKRWREHCPLRVTASTKTLKWCTEEALHYCEQFPKNTISFLTEQFALFQCAIQISLRTQYTRDGSHLQLEICHNERLLYLFKLYFCYATVQSRVETIFDTRASGALKKTYT